MLRQKYSSTHKTKKKKKSVGGLLSRSIKSTDASPDYVINHLTVGTKAKKNKHFFRSLMQREAVMSKESISNQDSRLRQVLILLTGGACSADLFVHTNTGKMKSHEEVSTAVLDLSNSYRMQHGYWGSKTKMVIRYMENKFQKAGALWHVMKVGAAILALMGSVRMIENFEKSTSGWKNRSERMKKVSLRKKKKKRNFGTSCTNRCR